MTLSLVSVLDLGFCCGILLNFAQTQTFGHFLLF
jgi:hypothetical protein